MDRATGVKLPTFARDVAVRVARSLSRGRPGRPRAPRRTPPDPPTGWEIGAPDFVGYGVEHAGADWWADAIHRHPLVHRPPTRPIELSFFERFWDDPFDDAAASSYRRWFARPPGCMAGEWTPRYATDFWTAGLLRRSAPSARILVMLRDPLDRFATAHDVSGSLPRPGTRGSVSRAPMAAFQRGLYGPVLRGLFASFPREQVLVLQYERCVRDPDAELARTQRFIGLPIEAIDPGRPGALDDRPSARLPAALHAALRSAYAADVAALPALVPGIDLSLWSDYGPVPRGRVAS